MNPTSPTINIPQLDRADGWVPNQKDISETPGGGHFFAMTPGGTKLAWTRTQLMHYSRSPLSKSPLSLPVIPGITTKGPQVDHEPPTIAESPQKAPAAAAEDGGLFQMDGL
eukprot:TRINITY_DN13360_c0_g1_i1.p1 TRINITY_DN13360_c0_g1~~TRINITY_DN13360_c0_g1_i1.p1  ORF type:complete len:111 (-),score=20.10 TRINITY_DN13360_c0_g1_i1:170-502(-)